MSKPKEEPKNKQNELYTWLSNRPGYLKCSAKRILERLEAINGHNGKYTLKEVENTLKMAKNGFKTQNTDIAVVSNKNEDFKVHIRARAKSININNNVYEMNPNNVLVIPDTHFPFERKGILEHCKAMQLKYNCGTVVHIGDEVDLCAISQWEKDPDGMSAGSEAAEAQKKMKIWYDAFPEVHVCIGNHTARVFRMARASGIPKKFIKTYEEAWEAPEGWVWSENWEFNGVLYTHGTGASGNCGAIKIATRHRQNTVIGHIHSEAGIQYSASKIDLVWGMQVGGAIDDTTYAAAYAKDHLKKSIVGCGIILDGKLPIFEPMLLK